MKKTLLLLSGCVLALNINMVHSEEAEEIQAEEAEEIQAKSLGELLELVRQGKVVNARINEQREQDFNADKSRQNQALSDARRQQRNEEARSERLESQFEANEQQIAGLQVLAHRGNVRTSSPNESARFFIGDDHRNFIERRIVLCERQKSQRLSRVHRSGAGGHEGHHSGFCSRILRITHANRGVRLPLEPADGAAAPP